ncbi:MAG: POTRA domain-containing protein [Rhodanobacter sp.]
MLQQTKPPVALPPAPGTVLTLPAPEQQQDNPSITFTLRRIVIHGNTLLSSAVLAPLVDDLQGHAVSLALLQQAAARITALYYEHGYPLAYAYLPAQKIEDGVLIIAVVEPRYDRIAITGKSRLAPTQARKTLGLKPGQPITQSALNRGLLLLNQTPGITVAGTLVRGASPASSTLDAQLTDTPIARAQVSVDDFGSAFTGRLRAQANGSLDNLFGYGSQISASGMTTQGGLLKSIGLNGISPDLGRGLRLGAYGSQTHYRLGDAFAALQQHGSARQTGADVTLPLILQPGRILQARLDVLQNRFAQRSAISGLDDRSHAGLLRLTLNGAVADTGGGVTSAGVMVTRGDLHFDTTDAALADSKGPQTAGSFWIAGIQLQRTQPLPAGLQLKADLSGQLSSKNLDGSEKSYLGGPDAVMSAPVSAAGGDESALLRLSLSHRVLLALPGKLEVAALLQHGEVWLNHSPYAGAPVQNRLHLSGAGLGLTYQWDRRVSAQLSYVHRLGESSASNVSRFPQGEVWVGLQLNI